MGHQSYVVVYKTEEEKEAISTNLLIIAAVKKHNDEKNWDIRGETIFHICDTLYYKEDIKCILFGNQ